jgi:hypothetical protein
VPQYKTQVLVPVDSRPRLLDAIAPTINNLHAFEEVESWLPEAGFVDAPTHDGVAKPAHHGPALP